MKDNSAINGIIYKVITNEELTSTESTMYEDWIGGDEGKREMVETWKNDEFKIQQLKAFHRIDVKGGWAKIQQGLDNGKQVSINNRSRKLFRDVATSAAAVLFILAAAYLFWYRKQDNAPVVKETVNPVAKQGIAPAQMSASLTLADGSKILLDSTKAGQLAQQGEAVVVNEKGVLKYEGKTTEQQELLFNTLTTAYAQKYAMVLADGSKVWLNAGASIRYPVAFTGNERKVAITGEAYFEVAHDPNKPFIVHVTDQKGQGMDVQVLGTHFNINAYDDEAVIKTTLLEGSVQIKLNDYQTLLTPGQQSQVGNGAPQVIKNVNVDAVVAWKNGLFSFENTDIGVVMRQLTKWYDIEVVYEGTKPSDKISGEMERDVPLAEVVKKLAFMTHLQFRIEGRKLIVPSSIPNEPQKSNK
ncbi:MULTISPECIES: FecR family protein [Niastella]|uniref:FecR domain-containing protein n=1 Tax=Niastella soli TaxID=2821487 RepID=A0ABS3YYE9_9BACT|nr:FecR family protein [Niastella soli]MBO9202949.1 FecR domain-containing protein [Niastella soli]